MAYSWQVLGEKILKHQKMLKHQQSILSKWQRDIGLAEVISKGTGKVWDRSDEASNEDEGDGPHAYLGAEFFLIGEQ